MLRDIYPAELGADTRQHMDCQSDTTADTQITPHHTLCSHKLCSKSRSAAPAASAHLLTQQPHRSWQASWDTLQRPGWCLSPAVSGQLEAEAKAPALCDRACAQARLKPAQAISVAISVARMASFSLALCTLLAASAGAWTDHLHTRAPLVGSSTAAHLPVIQLMSEALTLCRLPRATGSS